ncbi:hypothetical protein [Streptomyces rimosus]|uniref:hypothetical protein n=1 Tax=Streptomyces rimosus TaxID=1927 RepID=UPI00131B4BFD|nr:hypothetical protein [Streptomyces rimosus]
MLCHSRPRRYEHVWRQLDRVLERHVGCRLAALPTVDGDCAVADRNGARRLLRLTGRDAGTAGPVSWSRTASCLHALLVAGHTLDELRSLTVLQDG